MSRRIFQAGDIDHNAPGGNLTQEQAYTIIAVDRDNDALNRDKSDWVWHEDSTEIARLVRWLDAGDGCSLTTVLDILDRPDRWQPEYEQMCAEARRDTIPVAKCEAEDDLSPLLEASIALTRGARGR